ncbi:MAG: hypothetical protein AAGI11_19840 [Pseudomonadota bacterium]
MIEDYLNATRELKTRNQFNRVHIDLSRVMTPLQCAELIAAQRKGLLSEHARGWVQVFLNLAPGIEASPEPWVAEPVTESITLHHHGNAECEQHRKGLLIAFCGNSDLMGVPLPVFLQALPARDWNVLHILRHGRKRGAPRVDIAQAINELLDELRAQIARHQPSYLACVGMSSGGGMAMMVALRLEAQRCVSIGGAVFESWLDRLPELSGGRLPLRQVRDFSLPEYVFVYSEGSEIDKRQAEIAQLLFKGHGMPIPGVRSHNCVHPIARRGLLRETLFSLLGGFTAEPAVIQSDPGASGQVHG